MVSPMAICLGSHLAAIESELTEGACPVHCGGFLQGLEAGLEHCGSILHAVMSSQAQVTDT